MTDFEGPTKPGEVRNPEGNNGRTPITTAIRVLLTRPETDNLDDEPKNNAQRIALEWVKKAKSELAAMTALADRIEGKPNQAFEHTGKDGGDIGISIGAASGSVRQVVSSLTKNRANSDNGKAEVDRVSPSGPNTPAK